MPGAGGVDDGVRERQTTAGVHALEQLLGARLGERHPPLADGLQTDRIVVDAEHRQAAIRERQRERQADAAEADDGNVTRHGRQEVIAELCGIWDHAWC